jgi:hypothetical protein
VVDQKKYGPYAEIWEPSLQFSGDSKHFAFVAVDGKTEVVVIDGFSGPVMQSLWTHGKTLSVGADGKAEYLSVMDGKMVRVEQSPPQ